MTMRLGKVLGLLVFMTMLSALAFGLGVDCARADDNRILVVMGDTPQIWDIPVTPSQRLNLLSLFFPMQPNMQGQMAETPTTDRAEGKRMRRAVRAFGVDVIREMARKHEGRVSTERANCRDPMLHKITAENIDFMLDKIAKVPATPSAELDIGPLFDLLEVVKASKDVPEYDTIPYCVGLTTETMPVFGDAPDDWTPPPIEADPDEIKCPSCGQSFTEAELEATKKKAA